jgi:hypothetical protein
MIGKNDKKWGSEAEAKMDLAERLAVGKKGNGSGKVIVVFMGDNPDCS